MAFGSMGYGRRFGSLGAGYRRASTPAGSPYSLVAGAGSFILTGNAMAPLANRLIPAAVGAFILTGQAAALTYSGGAYAGPGDVVSGATHWYGLRAYNVAYATGSNPAIDLVDQAGANQITVNILSDGTLDLASIATWVTANSVTTIKVKKIYDQIGTSHLSQATLATMPILVTGSVTGLAANRPAMQFRGAQSLAAASGSSASQPLSFSSVAERIGTANGGIISSIGGNDAELRFGPSTANQVFVFAGGSPATRAATDSAFHAIQGVLNGASSVTNVDGTSGSTASAGTNGIANAVRIGMSPFSDFLTGFICEAGLWPSAFSGANMTSLSSNQHSYWGF
jgi:hypothetical protein